jgi:hypothetical protein
MDEIDLEQPRAGANPRKQPAPGRKAAAARATGAGALQAVGAGGAAGPPRPGTRGRPFEPGRSGNPRGRPAGAPNRKTAAAALLLAGEAEALTRKAIELALAGDPLALRLCLERLLPPCRERTVRFALPPLDRAADVAAAMKAVAAAVADGVITPGEGETVARILGVFAPAIEEAEFRRRVERAVQPRGEFSL